ncbi:TetR/AcrR family transcriptional regulator [Ancylobacter rudongensis]|uniref:Transcriptional regulator, TetR family n=1 Tax=Ancylobacter rudongensis TaxID=177413 RepID=A0A1G4RWL1_9HYPH|nr:TetR/AcrR family transcriptional regulator [Ancylobacter rudongensis]SCW60855.1 transcriptional regulator, TetR family [Ancylobacter rudongensis]
MSSAPRPAAPARRGRDGADTRARIEAVALELFAQKGVAGTSVRDIALGVGVSEGALYRHFASKEELARVLYLTRYGALAAEICAIDADEPELRAKLRAVVGLACGLFDAEPALFAYLLIHQHEHLGLVPDAPEANVVEAVAHLLRGAGVPPERTALASAMALGCVVQPAVFALYGRLRGPLTAQVDAIAAAVMGIAEGAMKR